MPRINPKSKVGLFVSHVVPGVMRPMRVLWHEIFGFIFLVFAVVFARGSYHAVLEVQKNGSVVGAATSVSLVVVFLYFGITSFLKARKISRS